nr:hypothetical protein CFP56_28042 [Quercus suber]
MPWPRQHAHKGCPGFCCLPMGAVLILVACLCHDCFPIRVIKAVGLCTWACHGIGNVPTWATMALAACPLDVYFPKVKGMCWPCLCALVVVAMGAALNLAVWLCRGCFPMEAIKA